MLREVPAGGNVTSKIKLFFMHLLEERRCESVQMQEQLATRELPRERQCRLQFAAAAEVDSSEPHAQGMGGGLEAV